VPWDPDGKAMLEALRAKPVPPIPDRENATALCEAGRQKLANPTGDPEELDSSFQDFKSSLERDPTYPDAYAGIASVLMRAGKRSESEFEHEALEAAFEWAERGLAYDPSNYGCVYAKALALAHLDRADDAFNLATYLLHSSGQRYETYFLLAKSAHLRAAQNDAMNYAYQAVLTAAEGAQKGEAERALGDLYFEYEQWERALQMYERCIESGPPESRLLHLASMCCARMKDYERALDFSSRSQAMEPSGEAKDVELEVRRILASRDEKEKRARLRAKP